MFASASSWLLSGWLQFGQKQVWTVAVETGIQNVAITVLIVQLNFDCPAVLVEMMQVVAAYLFGQISFMGTALIGLYQKLKIIGFSGDGMNQTIAILLCFAFSVL